MLYKFENLPVYINNKEIMANSISIGSSLSISNSYRTNGEVFYKANQGVKGTCDIVYYVTGEDFLYEQILDNPNIPLSGYFGGTYFLSGYINSHSISAANGNFVTANASISFYSSLYGTIETGIVELNTSKIGSPSTSTFENDTEVGDLFSYALSTSVEYAENYGVFSEHPIRISSKRITSNLNLNGNDIGSFLAWSGESGYSIANIGDVEGQSLQSYGITGMITSKNLSMEGDILRGSVNLVQVR